LNSENHSIPVVKEYLLNHTSEETAYIIEDYPYGRSRRCKRKVWIETDPKGKKGDRLVSRTQNPENGRWNKPKKSTYAKLGVLYKDDKGHVHWSAVSLYTKPELVKAFVERIGGTEVLQPGQLIMYRSLMGIDHTTLDDYGNPEKPFRLQWVKSHDKLRIIELKVTFNRPDGVAPREVFEALKSADTKRLDKLFDDGGRVRVCVRNGVLLGFVTGEDYRNYLASDSNTAAEDGSNQQSFKG